VERFGLSKKSLAAIGKELKKEAKKVTGYLAELDADALKALKAAAEASGSAKVEVGGESFSISNELIAFESTVETQHVEIFTPNVIEPSFGIDRILTAIYEHTFSVRAEEGAEEAKPAEVKADRAGKAKMDKKEGDKAKAGVLALPAEIAPYKCVILPLDMRVAAKYAELLALARAGLAEHGLQYKVDESGASIGRRYARGDELGIPFAITIDFDSLEPGPLAATATLRERDSTEQVRLPLDEIPGIVAKLCTSHPLTWAEVHAAYSTGATSSASEGAAGSGDKLDYLRKHGVAARLNAAVNELAAAQPDDPIAWLSARLGQM
jgi:glycyl-tRNA synthetase